MGSWIRHALQGTAYFLVKLRLAEVAVFDQPIVGIGFRVGIDLKANRFQGFMPLVHIPKTELALYIDLPMLSNPSTMLGVQSMSKEPQLNQGALTMLQSDS